MLATRLRSVSIQPSDRQGVVLVENALVISVFMVFVMGLIEFGHVYLVVATLNSTAKRAARAGAVDAVTTATVKTQCNDLLNKSIKAAKCTVVVKDASSFDNSNFNPTTINYTSLPDIELSTAASRQLYVVRITVPYKDVSLMPPLWVKTAVLHGQSVMRHE